METIFIGSIFMEPILIDVSIGSNLIKAIWV